MDRTELAEQIAQRCRLTGTFTLRSGKTSNTYFDKYLFEGDPALLQAVCQLMYPLLPNDTQVLAGLELGGVPLATMLSHLSLTAGGKPLPAAFVRKAAKTYGTAKLAEGADVAGRRTVIIEDVVTTGGQILQSAADLRARGALIDTVACVIQREAAATEKLREAGLNLVAVFRMEGEALV